jgi:acetyl esterase/lipase
VSSRDVLDQPAPPPDVVLRYGPLPEHVIDVRWPAAGAGPASLVVVVHGGYWREEFDRVHAGPQCVGLAEAGYAVAAIEYRRTGSGSGWDELSADVLAALGQVGGLVAEAAERAGVAVDPQRSVLVGHSAGGQLVAWAATRDLPGVVGAVSLAGVLDLTLADDLRLDDGPDGPAVHALLGGSRADVPQRYAAADPTRLGTPTIPVVALHGDADDVAPLVLSESYCAATGQRLVVLAGTDHFAWIDPQSRAWAQELAAISGLTEA